MIPVRPQPEPEFFHKRVRRPGLQWLKRQRLRAGDAPLSARSMPAYWRRALPALWNAYGGICAYFCVYIGSLESVASVDHFMPKSLHAELAYEWCNYRLACALANGRKDNSTGVLDPFTMQAETFLLNLASGRMRPSPRLSPDDTEAALYTLAKLGLNDPMLCDMRTAHLDAFLSGELTESELERLSPYVLGEARRQGFV